jgi:hypothetical protein
LPPFLKAIQKCTDEIPENRRRICDEVINTASSNVDNQLMNELNGLMRRPDQRTLNAQHNVLIDENDPNHISRR